MLDEVPVTDGVPVWVALGVILPLNELLPVLEGEAPELSAAVGVTLIVVLADKVVLAVPEGVNELVPVEFPVPVEVGVWLGEGVAVSVGEVVAVLLRELLAVFDAVAPKLSDAVGETLMVELALKVLLPDTDVLGVGVPVPVTDGVPVPGGVGVSLLLSEMLPEIEGEAPLLSEAVGERLTVVLSATVVLGVSSAVPKPV